MSESLAGRPITLDQLIALNDEIAALARAGMPLERGLLNLGSDLPGRLGMITTRLGEQMSRGLTLAEALDASGHEVPRVYRAIVEAGMKSGRLAIALEGMAMFARGFAEARRSIGLALLYPMVVLILAYSLLLFILTTVIPRFVAAFEGLHLPVHVSLHLMNRAGEAVWAWGWIFPCLVVVFLIAWVGSRRASSLVGGGSNWILRSFPWMGSMMSWFEASSFAEILALLLEHQMPYPDALVLAGEASADRAIAKSSLAMAESIRAGSRPRRHFESVIRSRRCSRGCWRPGPSNLISWPRSSRWPRVIEVRHGCRPRRSGCSCRQCCSSGSA